MSEIPSLERPFGFSLSDSETSEHPMAGTVVDQIIALDEMGEAEAAAALKASARQELADIFAAEEAMVRRLRQG